MGRNRLNGILVVVNGPTSTGKTTTARNVQAGTDAPVFRFSTDDILQGFPLPTKQDHVNIVAPAMPICIDAVRDSAIEVAAQGNVVIADVVWQQGATDQAVWGERASARGLLMLTVGLSSDDREVRERIALRPDRHEWVYEFQIERVHVGVKYDLTVNTSRLDPTTVAEQLLSLISEHCRESIGLLPAYHPLIEHRRRKT